MGDRRLEAVLQTARRAWAAQAGNGVADAELLHRFVHQRDEVAFELLLRRHEQMVFGVCRHLLQDVTDTEDAFQITFLTLVCKAHSIARGQSVAAWLHRVACRAARGAAARRTRRRASECAAPAPPAVAAEDGATALQGELVAALHEELNKLPEKYRAPLVLCYLEGKTYAEGSRQLGCPLGTLSIRLTRGRDLLRKRLAGRGLALTATGLATALCEQAASAAVVAFTLKAGLRVAEGCAPAEVVSAQAAALIEGMMRTMSTSKLKLAAVALVLVLGMGLAVGGWAMAQSSPPTRPENPAPVVKAEGGEAGKQPPPPAARPPEDGIKKEAASTLEALEEKLRLIGSWQLTSFTDSKEEHPARRVRAIRNIFEGTKLYVMSVDSVARMYTWKVDPTKSPKAMDWIDEKGELRLGIYAMEGEELTVCFFSSDSPDHAARNRPGDLKPGPGKDVSVFRRQKPGENWKRALFQANFESVKKPDWVSRTPMKASETDNDERKLLIARFNEALEELKERYAYLGGQSDPGDHGSVEELALAARRLLVTDLELNPKPADQSSLREKYLEFTKDVEEACRLHAYPCEGYLPRMTTAQARTAKYLRLEAELELLQAQRKAQAPAQK
jgi:RNA polymerase sigma factor (sigma-70 family)